MNARLVFFLALLPFSLVAQQAVELPAALKGRTAALTVGANRVSGSHKLTKVPEKLAGKTTVLIDRGDGTKAGVAWTFTLDADAQLYVAVLRRGKPTLPPEWKKTEWTVEWQTGDGKASFIDDIYTFRAAKGPVKIPGHDGRDEGGTHGVPHLVILAAAAAGEPVAPVASARVSMKLPPETTALKAGIVKLAKGAFRTQGAFSIQTLPERLVGLEAITLPRGEGAKPGLAYGIVLEEDAWVYLFVHDRGPYAPGSEWVKTAAKSTWSPDGKLSFSDSIYKRRFPKGRVEVPAHTGKEGENHGVPHLVVASPVDLGL